MILGDYPQNEQEIELLHRRGVTAVLNLQTIESMRKICRNLDEMKEIYERNGIYVRPCQIPDIAENIFFLLNIFTKKFYLFIYKKNKILCLESLCS